MEQEALSPPDLDFVRDLVRTRSAIVLESAKAYLVQSRLEPLARREGLASLAGLIKILRQTSYGALHIKVVEAMTTNETSFFRDLTQYCSLRWFRWFYGWCSVHLHNGRSRPSVRCVRRVPAFHHPWLEFSTTGYTQQFCRRLKQQPIPCLLALRGEGPQIGAGCAALTAPWP